MNIREARKEIDKMLDNWLVMYENNHKRYPEEWPIEGREIQDWIEDFLCMYADDITLTR